MITTTRTVFCILLVSSVLGSARAQWVAQPTGLTPGAPSGNLLQFAVVDTNIVWAARQRNTEFIRSTNGGATWSHDTVTGAIGLLGSDITAVDSSTAWVIMHDPSAKTSGAVFRTTNGGRAWVKQTTAFAGSGGAVGLIHFFDRNNGLACGYPNSGYMEFYTTTDGGDHWVRVPSSNIPVAALTSGAILADAASVVKNTVAFCYGSSLYRTDNRGMTWTVTNSVFPGAEGFGLAFRDSLHGLACTFDTYPSNWLSRTIDGGKTWVPLTPPLATTTFWIEAAGNKGAYVITSTSNPGGPTHAAPGSVYTLDDGGNWAFVNNRGLAVARFASERVGWSGGETDSVFKWTGSSLVTSVQALPAGKPLGFTLEQNYPNPFNPSTTITYALPLRAEVSLIVYNTLGQRVSSLVRGMQDAGYHEVKFDASGLASGVYYYRIQAGNFAETKSLILLR
jgi:photosystem II stability/assembly factor-like uncharacterized protein